jgi:hypothetical protein
MRSAAKYRMTRSRASDDCGIVINIFLPLSTSAVGVSYKKNSTVYQRGEVAGARF